jgi:glycosyltransferase involved in cell wall biosynthesis
MKVALVQEKLPAYREKLFIELQNNIDLDIFSSAKSASRLDYTSCRFVNFWNLRLCVIPISILRYDRIILEANVRDLTVVMLALIFPSKVVLWGNWKTGRATDVLRSFLSSWCSRSIYYCTSHQMQFDPIQKRSAVANNTIAINTIKYQPPTANFVLGFLGSVNRRKGLEVLFMLLSDLVDSGYEVSLNIIGDGEYLSELMKLPSYKQNSGRINLMGRVEREEELSRLIQNCSVIISPEQAGLSIAHAFACSRPFVCYERAISGGEKYNIINGLNGFRSKDYNELRSQITSLIESNQLLETMCYNSKAYYDTNMSVSNFIKNIKFILE